MSGPTLPDDWAALEDTWAALDDTWLGNYSITPLVELGALTGFTLNDPVLGLLDSGVLDGGISYVDVTSDLIQFSTGRGRSRELERTNAGQLSISLRNEERQFDPLNDNSVFKQYTVPRKPVRVSVDGIRVFTGVIDDWNYTYSMNGLSVADVDASDAFSLFAREENSGASVVQELSGSRVNEALDQITIAWPTLERDIDAGNAELAAGIIDGNALSYLQQIEESESGFVFISRGGKVAFRERLFQPVANAVTFSDDGSGIAYDDIQIVYGTELLANNATVTSSEGTATASNTTSEVAYGVTAKSVDSLLAAGDLQGLADYIVAKYGVPEYRIERVRVNMRALDEAKRADVLSLELGDQADMVFTPNRIGAPIALRNRVIGISHDLTIDSHFVSVAFEELPFEFFILNDAVFGRLDDDAGVLGF